eukprot:TRINITY_DN23167_c0_g1_i1.p4 TRINITY_DN23167_c0_g1~~TRINITY_DN23167_c0_g1_i1.p4  ORF type:complete len:156 (+),score=43.40 TRINITY_DN23167_c0_g1_i1:128-595(+)
MARAAAAGTAVWLAAAVAAAPAASGGFAAGPRNGTVKTFVQKQCIDPICSLDCVNELFPENECILVEDGGSAIATSCSAAVGLTLHFYVDTDDCSGRWGLNVQPVGQCTEDVDDGYFLNDCGSGNLSAAAASSLRRPRNATARRLPQLRRRRPAR